MASTLAASIEAQSAASLVISRDPTSTPSAPRT